MASMNRHALGAGWLLLLLAWLPDPAVAEPAQPPQDPYALVERTSQRLIDIIQEGKTYFEQDPQRFYREVTELLDPIVDFEGFARGVMGPQYARQATPAQRREFVDTFKTSLINTYARALLEFDNEQVRVIPDDRPPRDPTRREVKMELELADGRVFPVTYSMVQDREGQWRMRNIVVGTVNIGMTYRRQFESAMRSPQFGGDMSKVIANWGDQVAEIEVALEEES